MYSVLDRAKRNYSDSVSLPVIHDVDNDKESCRIVKAALYTGQFSEVFSRLLQKGKMSCYQVSQYSGIDQAYLSRLKTGEKQNPSPEIMIKISLAFVHASPEIRMYDIESLFNSIGRTIAPIR